MSVDLTSIDPDSANKIETNVYYKKLQQDLKEKQTLHQSGEKRSDTEDVSDQKVGNIQKIQSQATGKLDQYVDKFERGFQWEADVDGESQLSAIGDAPLITTTDLKNDGRRILRLMGQTIDFSSRLPRLKENYMQTVLQSRTHNMFLSKYAQLKLGLMGQLLSVLGISSEELKILQNQAIQAGIEENIRLVAENVYNMELIELIYGRTRKSRKPMARFQESQRQLIANMALLGKVDYWNPIQMREEQARQCARIVDEFKRELSALNYQLTYFHQEGSNHGKT